MGLSTWNRNREKRVAERVAASRPSVVELPAPQERLLATQLQQARDELATERARVADLEAALEQATAPERDRQVAARGRR